MQKIAVTATNIIPPIGNKTTDLVLARIVFPIDLPAAKPEQDFGELTIARAVRPTVKRPEHQDMPFPRLLREIVRPPALGPAGQHAP